MTDITSNPTQEQSMLANILLQYYSQSDKKLDEMFTDSLFVMPDQVVAKTMSEFNPNVFNYHFTQKTNNSLLGTLFSVKYEDTPIHGDELAFLFDIPNYLSKIFSEEEK